MTEKQLLSANFKKEFTDDGDYYFIYNQNNNAIHGETNGDLITLISNSNLESKGKYVVEFYDSFSYKFTKITQVKRFIKILKEIEVD